MKTLVQNIKTTVEPYGFEVLSRISDIFGVRVFRLRILYIYLSFATLGLTFLIYLVLAFFLWLKDSIFIKRKSKFEL